MSIVIGLKVGDTIYMGADTQRSCGGTKSNCLSESNFKITRFANGVLLGHVGTVRTSYLMYIQEQLFDGVEKHGLTKEFLVKEIVPVYKQIAKDNKCVDKSDNTVNSALIVAYKDKMFRIRSDFGVVDCDLAIIGSGTDYAIPYIVSEKTNDPNERILKGIYGAEKFNVGVSRPCVLINTTDLEYEIVK